jgi:hypothetical protein
VIRGRSREAGEKGKGMSRDLSHALIKVSEVFGLEPEEGREPRDRWKEFKKGALPFVSLNVQVPHGNTNFRNLQIPDIIRYPC